MLQVLPDTKTQRAAIACALSLLLVCPVVGHADAYGDARGEMIAAYRAEDFSAMRAAAQKALDARPGYPGARFNLALAELLDGDADKSLSTLNDMVVAGIDYGVEDMEEFAPLQQLAGWQAYKAAVATLQEPTGIATVAYRYDVADFVPEGIAINDDGELFLGSIHRGELAKIGAGSEVISDATSNAHWSIFGMRFDADGGLWFASASVPEFRGNDDASNGRTGLFRIDLETQQITDRALLPPGDTPMVLGDLVIDDANTIYATESLSGILYRYSIAEQEFAEVVSAGALRSMQGLVLDESGKYLYVADYVGGLFRIRLGDGDVTRVTAGEKVTLFGIDGLYRYGDELIVIQNGISPSKVAALKLSDDGLEVTEQRILAMNLPEFDEPTLGVVVGDQFYFVANSHWNRFDREGNLPDNLTPPIILKLPLN
jgi:sugar lactone lactonase YvrE